MAANTQIMAAMTSFMMAVLFVGSSGNSMGATQRRSLHIYCRRGMLLEQFVSRPRTNGVETPCIAAKISLRVTEL